MPPEMIKEIGHGYKLDIWALGVLLYEMTQGRVPFNGALDKDKASAVCALRYTVPSKSSQSLQNLIGQCLRYKPEERPTAEEILMHPWFGRFNSMMGKQVTGTYGICEINEITDSKVQLLYKNGDHEVVTFQKAKELVFQAEEKIRQDHESAQRLQEEVALLLLPQPEEDEDKQKGIFNGSSSGESVNSENIDQIDVALMQKPPGGTMSQFASPRKFSLPGSSQPVSPSSNVATPQKYSLPVDSTGACPSPGGRGPINNMKSITPSPGDYRPSYKSHGSDIVPEDDHDATITQLRSHIDKLQETCVPEQATSPRIKDFSLSAVIGEDMESEAPTFFEELSIIKEYEETNSQLQERILQLEWLQAEIDAELAQKRFLVEKYQERRKRQTKKSGLFNAVSRLFGCSSRYRQ